MGARLHFALVCSSLVVWACGGQHDALQNLMRDDGFLRVTPARTDLPPATLVVIDAAPTQVAIKRVCSAEDAFPGVVPPHVSDTPLRTLRLNRDSEFSLEADYLKSIKVNPAYSSIDDVTLTLSNAKVLEYDIADLYRAYPARTTACTRAVAAMEAQNKVVYAILQSFLADIDYHIVDKSKTGGTVGLSAQQLGSLTATLGGTTSDDKTLTGKQVVLALRPETIKPEATRGTGSPDGPLFPGPRLSHEALVNLARQPARVVVVSAQEKTEGGAAAPTPSPAASQRP